MKSTDTDMKKLILSILLVVSAFVLSAQGKYLVGRSDFNSLEITFTAPDALNVEEVSIKGSDFSSVSIDGFGPSSEVGAPSLPTLRKIIEIPLCDGISVTMKNERHIILDGASLGITHAVAPVQPSVCKTASRNSNTLAYNDNIYTFDAFYGLAPVTTENIGVARDRNLAEVIFSPVQYNPVTNQFIVYTYVEAVLTYINADVDATNHMHMLHHSPAFGGSIQTINTLGYSSNQAPKSSGNQAIRYLIVAHSMFRGYLDDFVMWKKRTGFIVDVAYTDDAGVGTTQQSIKTYIKRQYITATETNPAPTYLLIVGDVEQIPAKSYDHDDDTHVSDLDYSLWSDDDNIPDCYYGRFSAQTVSQLTPQINKILVYERYEFPDEAFLDKAILVAGVDGGNAGDLGFTCADPTMDYAAKRYVNGDYKTVLGSNSFYRYQNVTEYKNNPSRNPNATNVSVVSNSEDEAFRAKCNEGAGFINYTAHGYDQGWASPGLSNDDVSSMSNVRRCGLMIGNCCQSGKFDTYACFGEALLRRANYCGAVGYIGGSDYTYWGEDFSWAVGQRDNVNANMSLSYDASNTGAYDHMFHTHGEAFSEWAPTMGSLMMCGNMAVQNSNSGLKDYYWQIYHIFGDPSLMPWLSRAKDMPLVWHGLYAGSSNVSVTTAPYAYVALTNEANDLIGAALADVDGQASISSSEPLSAGVYVLASTAQNYKPRIETVAASSNGIFDSEIQNSTFNIYPNPASSRISVDCVGLQKVELLDAVGNVVLCQSDAFVDISSLSSGIYVVRVTTDGGVAVKKNVKQ